MSEVPWCMVGSQRVGQASRARSAKGTSSDPCPSATPSSDTGERAEEIQKRKKKSLFGEIFDFWD